MKETYKMKEDVIRKIISGEKTSMKRFTTSCKVGDIVYLKPFHGRKPQTVVKVTEVKVSKGSLFDDVVFRVIRG